MKESAKPLEEESQLLERGHVVQRYVHRIGKNLKESKSLGALKLKVISEVHEEFNRYLLREFGKSFDEYKKHFVKLNTDDIFECISIIEEVSRDVIWDAFESIVLQKREACSKAGVNQFLFLYERDGLDEAFIERCRKEGANVQVGHYFHFGLLNRGQAPTASELYEYSRLVIVLIRKSLEGKKGADEEKDASRGQRYFEEILREAIRENVSDVHVVPTSSSYLVYFRKDGFFVPKENWRLSFDEAESLIVYLMRRAAGEVGGQFNPDTRLVYQDARISVPEGRALYDRDFDLRLAFIPDGTPHSKLEVCMRILYKNYDAVSGMVKKHGSVRERLVQLGYLEEDVKMLENVLYKRNGIVIVSGITNSGKSTLVSNLLAGVKNKKIGTIEDPVEYYVDSPNYVQHQIFISDQEKIKMDFVDYVKAFKRSDYDIVFVGEWRNHKGLTEALLEQAYAGQLIFTTLHVGSSFQVLKGLESVFKVNIEELKPVLLLCWNQVLVPRLCPYCRQKAKIVSVSAETLEICRSFPGVTEEMIKQLEDFVWRDGYVKGKGCSRCYQGYVGRQVIYDYFLPTVDFWERLGSDYSHYNVMKAARVKKTKIDTFLQMVKLGLVDVNDVYLVI